MAKAKRAPQVRKKLGGPRPAEGGPRLEKTATVEAVKQSLTGSPAVLLSEYRGLTVQDLAELRSALRAVGANFKIVKNTLAAIAAREAGAESLVPLFEGPVAMTFAGRDPVAAAKQLSEFAKKIPALTIKGGLLEGRALSAAEAGRLASIEPREVLLAKAAGMFLAPIQQVANLFAAPLNQLGAVLAQRREQLETQSAA